MPLYKRESVPAGFTSRCFAFRSIRSIDIARDLIRASDRPGRPSHSDRPQNTWTSLFGSTARTWARKRRPRAVLDGRTLCPNWRSRRRTISPACPGTAEALRNRPYVEKKSRCRDRFFLSFLLLRVNAQTSIVLEARALLQYLVVMYRIRLERFLTNARLRWLTNARRAIRVIVTLRSWNTSEDNFRFSVRYVLHACGIDVKERRIS